ncbi:MAG: hypothetical protein PW735_07730 [Acidobacteriaceae bacterium]|nr:hypothetical protein [Acidobacteriaceae bacterium]
MTKSTHYFKKTLGVASLALLGAALTGLPAKAQDTSAPSQSQSGEPGQGPMRGGPQQMYAALNLTADQQQVFHEAMKEQREKMRALREDTSLDEQSKHAQMKQIHEEATAKMRAVLTDDQKTQFDQIQQEMMQRMRERRDGGSPPPPPPDGSTGSGSSSTPPAEPSGQQ